MSQEYARHDGHADQLRESVDGRTGRQHGTGRCQSADSPHDARCQVIVMVPANEGPSGGSRDSRAVRSRRAP